MNFNVVDVVVFVIAVVAAFRGWRLGLLGQVFELGGGFAGLLLGLVLGPRIASAFTNRPGLQGAVISLVVLFVAVSIGQTLGYILGHRFGALARRARLGIPDAVLGAALGITITAVSFWLIGNLLVQAPTRGVAKSFRRSEVLQALDSSLPRPPNVFAYLRQYLSTAGFPQVFAGLPRPIGPPVKLPSNELARQAIEAVQDSTVRIVVPACGGTQLGSGWIAAPNTVVTNAHVVAGGDAVTVQEPATGDHSGTIVLFDPRTDIAVIRADVSAPVLQLDSRSLDIGTPGATLGYPGERGGVLVPRRAALQGNYEAVGYDIYGRRTVSRQVYELRSPVREGDSGGPFALPSGEVGGVVFAASTTDGDIGYALAGPEVVDEIERGAERTEAVGTGPCTH